MSEQTWWDNQLPNRINEFQNWVGDENAATKKFTQEFVLKQNCKSIVDMGCGFATDYKVYNSNGVDYLGVDSSKFINEKNLENNIPMLQSNVADTNLQDSSYDVAYSRHVAEHQKDFRELFSELIRVGKRYAINIFFIPPGKENIKYDNAEDLYHNTYSMEKIEDFLRVSPKVEKWEWVDIETEKVLLMYLKEL